MTRLTLLALFVVLAGLRLRAVNAAPRHVDRAEGDLQEEILSDTASAAERVVEILEKLDKEDWVKILLSDDDVLMTEAKTDSRSSEDLSDDLSLEKRGPISNGLYTFNGVTFEQLLRMIEQLLSMMNSLQKEQGTV